MSNIPGESRFISKFVGRPKSPFLSRRAVLVLVLALASISPAAASIAFVQGGYSVPATPQTTVTVTYTAAQTIGDLNVVIVGWADTTARVNSVTDSKGNVYQLAVGPTLSTNSAAQSIYYAKNVAAAPAGGNTVTVVFTTAANYPDIRILEYSGIDPTNPLDESVGASGSSATSSSGTVATTNANDLLIGANDVTTYTRGPGSGYTQRLLTSPDGDIAEDRIVTAAGSYSATAALGNGGAWVQQLVAFRAGSSGPGPSQVGQWSGPFTWPMVGIHATLMPNGKVLTWEDENASPAAQVWDPTTSTFTAVPYNAFDLFCSGHTVLPDGRIMVAGGHNGANYNGIPALTFFTPSTQKWSAGPNMAYPRWYPTVTELPDGRQLITSGAINCEGCNANTPEMYDPTTNAWTQLTSATINLPIYPHMFVLPDGRVIVTGSYELPVVTQALDLKTLTWTTIDPNVYDAGSSVMYQPGKILKSGTSANSDPPYVNAVANAYVLDMTQPAPAWRPTSSMGFPRSYHNLTVLPDGTVLATGGEGYTNPFDTSTAVYAAEIWSPATDQWTTMASMQIARVYHSTALLLPDGRVLSAGSGEYGDGSINQLNGEIYSPPYLFKGARPTITAAPSTLQYAQSFTVQTPDAANIKSVALIALGSVTHGFNQNQRYVPLTFTAGNGNLLVTAPANVDLAPPGYYMLFIVNATGVPAVAPIVNLPVVTGNSPPTAPNNLTGTATTGQVVLSWSASSSPVGIANYNVYRSDTASFTPSPSNRIGRPNGTTYTDANFTSSGTYYYLVTAQDTNGTESAPSNEASEVVSADTIPPAVSITAPSNGATVSGNVAVSANASDNVVVASVQFEVDGASIGSPVTTPPYGFSWATNTVTNGPHTVTAIATDGAGLSATSAPIGVTVNNSGPAQIAFVQRNYSVPATPQTAVSVTFTAAQVAGDLNVVAIGWSDTTSVIHSITDTKGNTYVLAAGPTALSGVQSQAIYYAKNINAAPAGANTITVQFNAAVPYPDVRILEYSGLDTTNPLDVTAGAAGTGTSASSGSVTTANADDLIFGADYVTTLTKSAGTGFTSRVITSPDGDIAEDRIVSTAGSYSAAATLGSSGGWIMQMVAFRAAGSFVPAIRIAAPPK